MEPDREPDRDAVPVWRGPADLPRPWRGCVATVGVFDGLHLGHRALIRTAVAEAARHGLPAVLVTFDPHPLAVVDPARTPRLLTTVDERAALAAAAGISGVYVCRFDLAVARTAPARFVADVLVGALGVVGVVVGEDFRFGAENAGDVDLLRGAGVEAGFDVHAVRLVTADGRRCSSSLVRRYVHEGRDRDAARVLGRPAP